MTSSLRGHPDSIWSLARAVDALVAAGRRMAPPGFLWIAGLGYQFLNLGWSFGAVVGYPIASTTLETPAIGQGLVELRGVDLLGWVSRHGYGALVVAAPMIVVYFRLVSGLARLSPAERWRAARGERRTPRLAAAWRAGRGTTFSALGLWLQFLLMMVVASIVFLLPVQAFMSALALESFSLVGGVLSGATVALVVIYGFLLSVLFQLSLHSLVRNRRGVGSALLHAWRIARNDPFATTRAVLVDAVLYVTVLAVHGVVWLAWSLSGELVLLLLVPLSLCIEAIVGGTRCAYWSSAYEGLGGISTVDDQPG